MVDGQNSAWDGCRVLQEAEHVPQERGPNIDPKRVNSFYSVIPEKVPRIYVSPKFMIVQVMMDVFSSQIRMERFLKMMMRTARFRICACRAAPTNFHKEARLVHSHMLPM